MCWHRWFVCGMQIVMFMLARVIAQGSDTKRGSVRGRIRAE